MKGIGMLMIHLLKRNARLFAVRLKEMDLSNLTPQKI
jgi:hypothetical protein